MRKKILNNNKFKIQKFFNTDKFILILIYVENSMFLLFLNRNV